MDPEFKNLQNKQQTRTRIIFWAARVIDPGLPESDKTETSRAIFPDIRDHNPEGPEGLAKLGITQDEFYSLVRERPSATARTHTDSRGQFLLTLKKGTYLLTAEDELPYNTVIYSGKDSISVEHRGTVLWVEPLEVDGGARVIFSKPFCSAPR